MTLIIPLSYNYVIIVSDNVTIVSNTGRVIRRDLFKKKDLQIGLLFMQ